MLNYYLKLLSVRLWISFIQEDPMSPRLKSVRSWQRFTRPHQMLFSALVSRQPMVVEGVPVLPWYTTLWTLQKNLNLSTVWPEWVYIEVVLLQHSSVIGSRDVCASRIYLQACHSLQYYIGAVWSHCTSWSHSQVHIK